MVPPEQPIDDDLSETAVLRRRLGDLFWEWARRNWKAIASTLGGVAVGAVSATITIWVFVSNAVHASHDAAAAAAELKETVAHLVTQRELDVANGRIAELERQMNQAAQHASEPPIPKRKSK